MASPELKALLAKHGLTSFEQKIVDDGFTTIDSLANVTEADLTEYGMNKGSRRLLLSEFKAAPTPAPVTPAAVVTAPPASVAAEAAPTPPRDGEEAEGLIANLKSIFPVLDDVQEAFHLGNPLARDFDDVVRGITVQLRLSNEGETKYAQLDSRLTGVATTYREFDVKTTKLVAGTRVWANSVVAELKKILQYLKVTTAPPALVIEKILGSLNNIIASTDKQLDAVGIQGQLLFGILGELNSIQTEVLLQKKLTEGQRKELEDTKNSRVLGYFAESTGQRLLASEERRKEKKASAGGKTTTPAPKSKPSTPACAPTSTVTPVTTTQQAKKYGKTIFKGGKAACAGGFKVGVLIAKVYLDYSKAVSQVEAEKKAVDDLWNSYKRLEEVLQDITGVLQNQKDSLAHILEECEGGKDQVIKMRDEVKLIHTQGFELCMIAINEHGQAAVESYQQVVKWCDGYGKIERPAKKIETTAEPAAITA